MKNASLAWQCNALLRYNIPMHALVLFILLSFMMSPPSLAMTVEEAYAAIPHRRTAFDAVESRMRTEERDYLARLFPLLEEATVARVETLQWFTSRGKQGQSYPHYSARIKTIRASLAALPAPERLKKVHKTLLSVLDDHDGFFKAWLQHNTAAEKKSQKPWRGVRHDHPLVARSHRNLLTAYMAMSKLYPHESQHNQQAFYDVLCALDFL